MTLRLFDARRGGLHPFPPPADRPRVGLYVCGVTPYDTGHLGHAYTYVGFDVMHRYLEYLGHDVVYVQNLTDVDDDMLRQARESGEDYLALGNRHVASFLSEMAELNWLPPDHYPRATQHIPQVLALTERLVATGVAYAADGNVFFEVAAYPRYGELSGLTREEMLPLANERGNVPDMPGKREPLDFVLWQRSLPDEPAWDSPWGPGRPGWHIECSAMCLQYLGPRVTIHGGGADLIFPHHESEIVQSEGATGQRPFVDVWMHAAMVYMDGAKMSKSLGNMVFVRDLLREDSADALRVYLLSHHYAREWSWDASALSAAAARAERLALAARQPDHDGGAEESMRAALREDFDTPRALEALEQAAGAPLRRLAAVLGLRLDP